jgi:hypothetical protein
VDLNGEKMPGMVQKKRQSVIVKLGITVVNMCLLGEGDIPLVVVVFFHCVHM